MAVVDLAVVADLGDDRLGDGEVQAKGLLAPDACDAEQALHRDVVRGSKGGDVGGVDAQGLALD